MNSNLIALAFVAAATLAAPAAKAASITLYNTGVSASGALVADGTLGDAHYALVDAPGGSSTTVRAITSASGWPIASGVWMADNSRSRWIGPNNDSDLTGLAGNYVYRTTFDLNGLDETTASINGLWTTDNAGLDIVINGHSLGFTTVDGQFAHGFRAFQIDAGFVAGINTLDFVVSNGDGPTGLRVELVGDAEAAVSPAAVPEPASLLLAAAALGGLAMSRRRKA